jgi:hypothetical protein
VKILIAVLALTFSTLVQAEDLNLKTINQIRVAYNYHLTCASQTGEPQVNVTYHNGNTAYAFSGGMAVIWPKEGLIVRDWPSFNPMYPSWTTGGDLNSLNIKGELGSTAEYVELNLQDATNGRFKTQFVYINRNNGQQIRRELRCYANNYYPTL